MNCPKEELSIRHKALIRSLRRWGYRRRAVYLFGKRNLNKFLFTVFCESAIRSETLSFEFSNFFPISSFLWLNKHRPTLSSFYLSSKGRACVLRWSCFPPFLKSWMSLFLKFANFLTSYTILVVSVFIITDNNSKQSVIRCKIKK